MNTVEDLRKMLASLHKLDDFIASRQDEIKRLQDEITQYQKAKFDNIVSYVSADVLA